MLEHILVAKPLRTLAGHALTAGNCLAQFEIPPYLSLKCNALHIAALPISVLFYTQLGANSRASITKGTVP
jgi:hypothetical protein